MLKSGLWLLLFFSFQYCIAQKSDGTEPFVFRCYLLCESDASAIGFAHIYNESRKYGAIADSSGYFATNVKIGDTLALMALGYLGKTYIINAADTSTKTIYLTNRTYQIDEVNVSIPRTYTEFKAAIMEVDVDKNRPIKELPKHNPYKTPVLLDTNIISKPGFKIFHPVTAMYLKHSKTEKSKRKVWHLQQQELKQGEVDAKYNQEIITEITGLSDYHLINFMGWCNFSFNYLYELTPLEIRELIDSKFKEYQKCCYNGKEDNSITE